MKDNYYSNTEKEKRIKERELFFLKWFFVFLLALIVALELT